MSTVIDSYCSLCLLCQLWQILFCSVVDYVDCDRPWFSHMSTLMFVIEPSWLMSWLCRLLLNVIGSSVDYVEFYWSCLAHAPIVPTVIDTDFLLRRSFDCDRTCAKFVDCDQPWSSYKSIMSTAIDLDSLISRLCRLWLTLIGSCVSSVVCDQHWLTPVSTMSSAIDSFEGYIPIFAQGLFLSSVTDADCLMCIDSVDCDWFCRIRLIDCGLLIGSCVDSVDFDRRWLAHMSNLSASIHLDWPRYQLWRL